MISDDTTRFQLEDIAEYSFWEDCVHFYCLCEWTRPATISFILGICWAIWLRSVIGNLINPQVICGYLWNFASALWVKHQIILALLLKINLYYVGPHVKYLILLLWLNKLANGLIRFKWIYSNEHDINASYFLEYIHDALLMPIGAGHLINLLVFLAVTYVLPVQKCAMLYIIFIRLQLYCIICTGSDIITLIDLSAQ